MRWPPPRAHTAQPERWRMRRWSKEPRRMSVVERRQVASLARALSICFIYQYETIKQRDVSRVFQTFLRDFVFLISRPDCRPTESVRDGTMTLALSAVARQSEKSEGRAKTQRMPSPLDFFRSLRLGEIRFFPSEGSTPSPRIRAYCLEGPESLPHYRSLDLSITYKFCDRN